jgi:hypothetical protein
VLDLSAFAIALVIGWTAAFLRLPAGPVALRQWLVPLVWLGWLMVLALLVSRSGAGWGLVAGGAGLGLAGHLAMLRWIEDRGMR